MAKKVVGPGKPTAAKKKVVVVGTPEGVKAKAGATKAYNDKAKFVEKKMGTKTPSGRPYSKKIAEMEFEMIQKKNRTKRPN